MVFLVSPCQKLQFTILVEVVGADIVLQLDGAGIGIGKDEDGDLDLDYIQIKDFVLF